MKETTITILDGGVPIVGAEVIAGEFAQRSFTTDSNGQVIRSLADNFVVATVVMVRVNGVNRGTSGPILLEAGGPYTIDILGEV